MACSVAKLLNSDASDRAQIDSTFWRKSLMKVWRTMTRMTILRTTSLTKTNIEFDFRENDYDTARLRKSLSDP